MVKEHKRKTVPAEDFLEICDAVVTLNKTVANRDKHIVNLLEALDLSQQFYEEKKAATAEYANSIGKPGSDDLLKKLGETYCHGTTTSKRIRHWVYLQKTTK